ILDEELCRLPDVFRLPLVLCCLEGRTQSEAATLLGWTLGSVKGRLERGRQRLKDRLTHRGLTFGIGVGIPLIVAQPAIAAALREITLNVARTGESASGVVSALANGTSDSIKFAAWRIAVVASLVLVGGGLALMSA